MTTSLEAIASGNKAIFDGFLVCFFITGYHTILRAVLGDLTARNLICQKWNIKRDGDWGSM